MAMLYENWFHVYPKRGCPDYYRVLVFPTKEKMYQYDGRAAKVRGLKGAGPNYEAMTRSYDVLEIRPGRRPRRKPVVGEILVVRGTAGAGLVAHEMTHAALFYIGLSSSRPFVLKNDERLALMIGWLVRQFWVKWYQRYSVRNRKATV